MNYHLVCVQEFGQYKVGQEITAPDEVAMLLKTRDTHFVKRTAPASSSPAAPVKFIDQVE
jgi:hypothetical protein